MELPKVYEPGRYEADIYELWEKSNAFAPRAGAGDSFSVVVPPPNANGNLHLGHGLTMAIQDIATRYHRMKGDRTLLLPGADHAGFETQVVFEKELAKQGKSRFDFTREELYAQIWDFVAENRTKFEQQFRRLGASVDWSRSTFTLDEKIVKRAYATFKKMWDEGLIYRGERLVNFCTFHGTAFADIEVTYQEDKGKLWHIRYPLTDGSGEVIVATTRPETMLGDTAVAVHPDDARYKSFHGKTVTLPLVGREIPIIADDFVAQDFGTGAVKITPAHDPNDYEAGKRHNLPMIKVINNEGNIEGDMPEAYRGLTVVEAREKIVEDLEKAGALVKAEDHAHNVGHCYKCGTVIEPLLMEQWFVAMQPLAKRAIETLEAGKIVFYPQQKQTQLIIYLGGLRDWNISRQTAWGIPIPAFRNVDDADDWIYDERVTEEIIEVNGKTYHRDPDVFDTWFSSSSWPYATLDFPDGKDFKDFYPLSLMETGFDILMPWVSRMLMLGLYVTDEIPFKTVYLHGLVLDEHGQKMSKSKGNVINPIEIIDEFGADALRMGIITGQSAGNNQPFGQPKIVGARNFCNKLWNIARYVEGAGKAEQGEAKAESIADHWLLARLKAAAEEIANDLEKYRFAEAYEALYHFVWDDFADWYIEASKATPNLPLLNFALDSVLKIAHPFAPFVTETIWQTRGKKGDEELLINCRWPKFPQANADESRAFEELRTIVVEVRGVLKNVGLGTADLLYGEAPLIAENATLIARLAHLSRVRQSGEPAGLKLTQTTQDCWLAIDDETLKRYAEKLEEQQLQARIVAERLSKRLNNESYVAQAPAAIVAQTRVQLAEAEERLHALEAEAKRFHVA
ncbi:MAG TPA: valine--tRNA ligase [Candidatus Saccharimonadales bacterium]